MQIIALILAILKAFPVLDKWFDQIHDAKLEAMKKENAETVKTSIETGDQRPVEIAMGSTKAGEVSGTPGSVLVDKLPGVK